MKTFLFSLFLTCTAFVFKPNNTESTADKFGACGFGISQLTIHKRTNDTLQFSYKLDKPSVVNKAVRIDADAWLSDNATDKQQGIYKTSVRLLTDSTFKVTVHTPSANKKFLIVTFRVAENIGCLDNPQNNKIALPLTCINVQQRVLSLEAQIGNMKAEMQRTQDLQIKARLAVQIRTSTAQLNNLKLSCRNVN